MAGAAPPQPPVGHARRRWFLGSNTILDPFAESGSYAFRTTVRAGFDEDVLPRIEGTSTLLRQHAFHRRMQIGSSELLGTSGALYIEPESKVVPYLALVRSVLERDDFEAARKALDAVPLETSDEPEVRRLKDLLAPPRITVSPARDVDRTQEYRWLRTHWHEFRGQWIAVDGDTVVAASRSLKELREKLKALQLNRPPIVHRVD